MNTTNRPGASKAVVFIERGGDGNDQPCHFVDKVRHAEEAGFDALSLHPLLPLPRIQRYPTL